VDLSHAEIARYLRMGRTVPEGALAARLDTLLAAAQDVFAPRRVFARFPRADLGFVSRTLDRHLGDVREVFLLCTTLGAAFDAFQRRVSVMSGADAFVVQAIGAAAIEKWTDQVEDEVRATLAPGETLCPRYSPGYGDFPLAANRVLLDRLDTARRLGVSLTETLLLVPAKTVTAVLGVIPS